MPSPRPDSPRLLLTGFEPFRHFAINPSWIAAEYVGRSLAPGVVARRLPVDHHLAREQLIRLIDELRPQAVLAMGLAAGDMFRIERLARKVTEFSTLAGANEHRISFNGDALAASLARAGAPWRFSDDAGKYVCESTYWALLQHVSEAGLGIPCAFLHVPADSELWPAARTCDVVYHVVRDWLDQG